MNTSAGNELELVTALDITNSGTDEKPVYQFVYGSQVYGTLFGIYGRFKITDLGDEKYSVNELTLMLLNYQGVINVGFTAADPYYEYRKATPDFPEHSRIYLGITGLSMIRSKTIPIEPKLIRTKRDRFRFTFIRLLYPMNEFESQVTAYTDFGKPSGEVPNTAVFDSEFHARSGVDYFQNPLRPGMANYDSLTLENLRSDIIEFASPRCSQSYVNLFF